MVEINQEGLPIGSLLGQVTETGQWVPLKLNGANDGSEQARAIVIAATKKESKYLIIARHAIAKETGIVWPQTKSETIEVIKQQLEARGILVRL
ncbi:MAG: head decoration protein [Patescibacteria group bacterium]|nr:head decoration protein [Patescibacteria group bacterium]